MAIVRSGSTEKAWRKKMNQWMLTHGHRKKNYAGFLIREREVHKQEERSFFISVATGAESDTFTDICIQIKHCFKQYNQEPLCII